MVYVDVKQHFRAQELCESRGGRPGLPVHNSHYGLYAILNYLKSVLSVTGLTFLVATWLSFLFCFLLVNYPW